MGLAKVDGKTAQADAGGMITVKDVAIGGDTDDLASARGFFYHSYVPWYAGNSEDTYIISDFNEFTTPGVYHIRWRECTALDETPVTLNSPNAGNEPAWYDGILEVDVVSPCAYVSSYTRVQQKVTVTNNSGGAYGRTFIRVQSVYLNRDWYPWKLLLDNTLLGDGFRITNGIISVPEYEGATASAPGTSGLVPPAAAGDQELFMTGAGEWKDASVPPGGVVPFYNVKLGGTGNRHPIFWGQTEPNTGWLICDGGSDGRGGTVPDIREKFVRGASGVSDAGQKGGAASVSPRTTVQRAATGIQVQSHTLTVAEMPSHNHTTLFGDQDGGTWREGRLDTKRDVHTPTSYTGGSGGHNHGISDPAHTHMVTVSAIETLPPYYKLIYCVKLPVA